MESQNTLMKLRYEILVCVLHLNSSMLNTTLEYNLPQSNLETMVIFYNIKDVLLIYNFEVVYFIS